MSAEEPSNAVEVLVDVSKEVQPGEVQPEEVQPEEKQDNVPTDSMVEQMAPEFDGKPGSSQDSGAPSKAYFSKTKLYAAVATFVVIVIVAVVSIAVASAFQPTIRKYYISTEDVEWNYAPQGHDVCSGKPFKYPATKFTNRRYGNTSGFDNRIGTTYLKARFVEYTDATFTVRANRTSDWDHLGIMGPAIRAETGDQIHVTFRNGARFPFSISPSGLSVTKSSEGSSYHDETTWLQDSLDNKLQAFGLRVSTCEGFHAFRGVRACKPHKVLSGEQVTYIWNVPENAGPTDPGMSSTAWLYRSHSDATGEGDLNAGLMGPIIITRRGESSSDTTLRPKDVEREFVIVNHAVDENRSPYISANVFDKITKPALSSPVPGQIAFGALDRNRVLQALVQHATSGTSKISYATAKLLVEQSIAQREPLRVVEGRPIYVSFDRDSFDPSTYDAANGGHGAARKVLENMVETIINEESPGFQESNMMHAINGYVYCNQPGLTMKQGERVRWYIIAVGSDVDIHTPHWHGHTVLANGHRYDEVDIIPNVIVNADMRAKNVGTWLFHCHVNDHIKAGMTSLYTVAQGVTTAKVFKEKVVRDYFIAAEEVEWDYLPGGLDRCNDDASNADVIAKFFSDGKHDSIGRIVTKVRYVEYTDATFSSKRPAASPHMGILGPVVRAEVGDRIRIVFWNKARFPFSIHAHGVVYQKNAEGAGYNDGTPQSDHADDSVAPNRTYTYVWDVPDEAGPGPRDGSSKLWMYHSHVSEVNDTNAGLIGPIVITKQGMSTSASNLRPRDVDREMFLLFSVLDEGKSIYFNMNLNQSIRNLPGVHGEAVRVSSLSAEARANGIYHLAKDPLFKKYSKKHVINGFAFCTMPGLDNFNAGDIVRWNLLAIGDEIDFHTATIEGHSLAYDGENGGVVPLLPSSMISVDSVMKAGEWGFYDGATNHYKYGARTKIKVFGEGNTQKAVDETNIAKYYIAADEIEWDYAPAGKNMCSNKEFSDEEKVYTARGYQRIGTTYIKAVYREYKSKDFDTLRFGAESRFNPASAHLGLLGPIIKAVVGETIEIYFRNNLGEVTSLVPIGGPLVLAEVEAVNGVQSASQDGNPLLVVPGGEIKMTIPVNQDAGPVGRRNSVSYLYGSNANFVRDINSGLFGLFIIHGKDAGSRFGAPKGIHREVVALFNTFDENLSRYARINALKYAVEGETVDFNDPEYKESNRMHAINGFMHCNGPHATAKQHQHVRWYMAALGSSDGLHGPFISGYSYESNAAQMHNVALLGPGMTRTADLNATSFGKWLVRDAVLTHQRAGMSMFFDVKEVLHPGV